MNTANQEQIEQQKAERLKQEQKSERGIARTDSHFLEMLAYLKSQVASMTAQPVDLRSSLPQTSALFPTVWSETIGNVNQLHAGFGKFDQRTVDIFSKSAWETERYKNDLLQAFIVYGVAFKSRSDVESPQAEGQRAFLGKARSSR